MKKLTLALSVAAFSLVTACAEGEQESASSNDIVEISSPKKIDYKVEYQTNLLQKLPSTAVAYARIPSLLSAATVPQADVLYPALAKQEMQTQWESILQGINNNLISKIEDPQIRELVSILIHKQTAPLEVAVLEGALGPITPDVILQTKLNLTSADELNNLLEQIVAASQNQAQLIAAPDESGNFTIAIGPVKAFGYFDFSNKDLVIYGGPAAIESNLDKYRQGTLEQRSDLLEFEKQFDSSGAGFATWVDTHQLWKQLSPLAPPEIKPDLEKLNLQDIKFAYLGSGSKDGHSSMRVHLQYKEGSENLFHFPSSKKALDAQISPPLNYVASIPLLNQKNVNQIINLEEQFSESPKIRDAFSELTEKLKAEVNIDLNLLLSTFEGSNLIVKDKAGTWFSSPIQNKESFAALVEATQKNLGATLSKTTIEGIEITHYVLPGFAQIAKQTNPEDFKNEFDEQLLQLIYGGNLHLYWTHEGENLIISSLPQTLIARERHKSNKTARKWLEEQGVNLVESPLSIVSNAKGLPKTAYHMYLSSIQTLSDIAGVEPNLIALPLAEDLGLPEDGRIGMSLNTSKDSISLVFDYEQTPLDYVLSGNNTMTVVAVTGILAAVAVPAYQDYTVRAKGSEALLSASQLKVDLEEYYAANGFLPNEEDGKNFFIETETATIYYDANTGAIKIIYSSTMDKRLSDTELNLTPSLSDQGQVIWTCTNVSAPDALIASSCRK